MTGSLPDRGGRIDRSQLERILQRAAELQAGDREIGEGLTPGEVLDLGKEVGIPEQYLRQAMLEEHSRIETAAPSGFWDAVVGPGEVGAVRVVRGDPDEVERSLLQYMEKHELLVVQRRQPGRITWERLGGVQAALRLGMSVFDSGRARFMLAKADTVRAIVTPLEPGYCQVSLSATLRKSRGGYAVGAAMFATLGAASATGLFLLGAVPLVAALPAPVGLGLGWAVSRGYRPVLERVRLGLERALDHVEGTGDRPAHQLPPRSPRLLETIAGEVRRALTTPSTTPRRPDRPDTG
jgi:hypothetical protein